MTERTDPQAAPAQAAPGAGVTITGGTVAAGAIGGTAHTVEAGSINAGTDSGSGIERLRQEIAALIERLDDDSGDHLLARERAEVLHAELDRADPDGERVRNLWSRLRSALEVAKVAVDTGALAESVVSLFPNA